MLNFYYWILLNLFLPLSPFLIRLFILIIGKEGVITLTEIAELPEVLFFSIYTCVVNLNINHEGEKGIFESTIRIFLFIIIVLDCVTLGMIYSNNIGANVFWYSLTASVFPALIAPFYKFRYIRVEEL